MGGLWLALRGSAHVVASAVAAALRRGVVEAAGAAFAQRFGADVAAAQQQGDRPSTRGAVGGRSRAVCHDATA
jgi:hypothetical protein